MNRMYAVDANRVFLVSVFLSQGMVYFVAGSGVRDRMLLQFLVELFLAVPGFAYLIMQKQSVKGSFWGRLMGWKEWLLLLPFAVCVDKIAEFINVVSQLFAENSVGSHMAELVAQYPFPVAFFVIAVTPAICEELIFRCVLYRGYRRQTVYGAIVLTAFLFGMMHMNLNQFSYAFVLGLLFAAVNEVTGSVRPSVVLHLYINGRSTVVLYAGVNYLKGLREQYIAAELAGDTGQMDHLLEAAQGAPIDRASWLQEYMTMGNGSVTEQIVSLVPGMLVAVAGTAVLLFLLLRMRDKEKAGNVFRTGEITEQKQETNGWRTMVSPALLVGVLYCALCMFWK